MVSESLFLRDPADRAAELERDLAAVWPRPSEPGSALGWLTVPSVTRRITVMIADRLDARVDRVAGVGEGGDLLAMALALACGRPFCWIDHDGEIRGTLRSGENIAVVSVHERALRDGRSAVTGRGAATVAALSVLGDEGALFAQTVDGILVSGGVS